MYVCFTMETEFDFLFDERFRGHHVFKSSWTPFIGETLPLNIEGNEHDPHAVAIMKDSAVVVGHVPREVSKSFLLFPVP